MSTAPDIEAALHAVLPLDLHTHVPGLAQLLADVASGALTAEQAHDRLANPALAPLLRALAGQTLNLGDVEVVQQITIMGGTIQGDIVGKQFIIHFPPLSPALHQLRAPVPDFVGRECETEQLVTALSRAAQGGAMAAISGVRGMGGIGKTELAYRGAQRLAPRFPDAQIVLALQGAGNAPLTPEQALRTVITAFEPEAKLPDDLAALQGFYRSKLAGKRVLILADNARDAAQVEPLLPPAGCALLVTSRQRFEVPGMMMLDLGVLSPDEAVALLRAISPRVGDHAAELAKLCGYLPLALRVSASLLASDDTQPVDRYIQKLADERDRLTHLRDPDNPSLDVAASLNIGYAALAPMAQQALCQASVFPASFDREAARAVIIVDGDVMELLGLLRRRSLLEWDATAERYDLHDLVRAFGTVRLIDANAVRLRHARHYVQVAARSRELCLRGGEHTLAGLSLFDAERAQIDEGWTWTRGRTGDPEADPLLLDYANATDYVGNLRYDMRHERIPQLEAVLAVAERVGTALDRARALRAIGDVRRLRDEYPAALDIYESALALYRKLDDHQGEADVFWGIGKVHFIRGKYTKALRVCKAALALYRKLDDHRGEANVRKLIGDVYWFREKENDDERAQESYETALTLYRMVDDRLGEADVLEAIGDVLQHRREWDGAKQRYDQALALYRKLVDHLGEAQVLASRGEMHLSRRELDAAQQCYEQALELFREVSDRLGEANVLWGIGEIQQLRQELSSALEYYQEALALYQAMGERLSEANVRKAMGDVQLCRSEVGAAQQSYMAAEKLYRMMRSPTGKAAILAAQSQLALLRNNQPEADRLLDQAIAIYREADDLFSIAEQIGNYGWTLRRVGKPEPARLYLHRAADLFAEMGLDDYADRHRWPAEEQ
jgi:tetratricopeptide (TPR) repeat protein